jgi:ribosome-associated protein
MLKSLTIGHDLRSTAQNYKLRANYLIIPRIVYFCCPMIEFKVEGDHIPMIQLLKATGLVQTGGEAQMVVTEGEVMYNGHIDYRKRLKVRKGDTVEFRGKTIRVI